MPHNGLYNKVVIWLHGISDSPDPWINHMAKLGLEDTKFILPLAPQRSVAIYNNSLTTAWANVFGMDSKAAEDKQGIDESAARIAKLIQAEVASGIPPNRIVIVSTEHLLFLNIVVT